MVRRIVLGALAGLAAFGVATAAFAHAKLQSSMPAKDASGASPAEIVLTFSEAVTPAIVILADQDGHEVKSLGAARADGAALHVPVTAKLAPGHYTFTYRVAGADTHAVNGTLTFIVAGP
ncbi:MAG: copper resistance protein CopC [Rhodospirillaceae bacterium]|nr:copper resistance protein CopC [Rhodospirillaceae bacterium]